MSLEPLLRPERIAVVGASDDPARISGMPLRYLVEHGFPGRLFPINPKHASVQGLPCFPTLRAVPEAIDLALIALPTHAVLDALRQCADKKVRAAVVVSAGFAEVGGEGAALQRKIQELARESRLRVLGPNCQGFINVHARIAATFTSAAEGSLPAGSIALVTQSGALGGSLLAMARERNLGLSHWISTGNEADVTAPECLEYLLGDPETRVLAAYLEGVRDGRHLARVAAQAQQAGKPLVILKAGRSGRGREAVLSHTAAVAGDDRLYGALFRQTGVIQVEDLDEVLDAAAVLATGRTGGSRVGVLSSSGGAGVLLTDEAHRLGLTVPDLHPRTVERLRQAIPAYASSANPVDLTAQILQQPALVAHCLRAILEDDGIDAAAVLMTMVTGRVAVEVATCIVEGARRTGKLVAVAWMAGDLTRDAYALLRREGIPLLTTPRRLALALAAAHRAHAARARAFRT